MGGGSSSSRKSSKSGKIDYPTYLKESHQVLLAGVDNDPYNLAAPNGVFESIADLLGNSPYAGLSAFDPTAELAFAQAVFDYYSSSVAAVDPTALWQEFAGFSMEYLEKEESETWEDYARRAIDKADELYKVGEEFVAAVDEKRKTSFTELVEQRQRAVGALADVGAERTSTLQIALALIESRFIKTMGEYGTLAQMECVDRRLEFVNKSITQAIDVDSKQKKQTLIATQQMMEFFSGRLLQGHESSKLAAFLASTKIAASKDQTDQGVQLAEDNALWEIKLWQYGANVLNFRVTTAPAGGTAADPITPLEVYWRGRAIAGEIVLSVFFGPIGGILGSAFNEFQFQNPIISQIIDFTDPTSWAFGGGFGQFF